VSISQNGARRDVLETVLTHCWETALRREPISPEDNFFELGGHSLVAMRIVHKLRRVFGVPVDYVLVLECPTVATLARHLREAGFVTPETDGAGRAYLHAQGVVAPDPC
jgi:acyl carrier protein